MEDDREYEGGYDDEGMDDDYTGSQDEEQEQQEEQQEVGGLGL